ncbi:MAG: RNA-binding protein [Polyangiaceae bacterium]|jgi:RNA recognition motif-containing protein|nr:RNA-binding protein [Polyangiaceae bacterium]
MSRLYVSNLSPSASLANLRECFAACGDVVDVEMVPERNAYQSTSTAYVRMSTQAAAERAATSLHGTVLLGRSLVISHSPEPEARGRKAKDAEPVSNARITQQYRERMAMTYELACHSARVTVRMFFPEPDASSHWRIEARTDRGESVVEASDASRELALRAVAEAWRSLPSSASTPELDWPAIAVALKAVRAL